MRELALTALLPSADAGDGHEGDGEKEEGQEGGGAKEILEALADDFPRDEGGEGG